MQTEITTKQTAHTIVELPTWLLDAPYARALQAVRMGVITDAQFEAYESIWFYSAPRFSALVRRPYVSDVNRLLDLRYC